MRKRKQVKIRNKKIEKNEKENKMTHSTIERKTEKKNKFLCKNKWNKKSDVFTSTNDYTFVQNAYLNTNKLDTSLPSFSCFSFERVWWCLSTWFTSYSRNWTLNWFRARCFHSKLTSLSKQSPRDKGATKAG